MKNSEQHPLTRYLGFAAAFVLSAAVIASLLIIASGLADEETEAEEVADLLATIAAESGAVTDGYLAGPESAAQVVVRSMTAEQGMSDDELTSLLGNLTATQPNIVGAFVGYPNGSFLDVRRDETSDAGGYRIKNITVSPDGGRTVVITTTDDMLDPVDTVVDAGDVYDPRIRPWYRGINDSPVFWTDPYIFYSSQEPGITHSAPVTTPDGSIRAVVGVDVRLADLNNFLADRSPSSNGSAVVIDASGTVVAGSDTIDTRRGAQTIVDVDTTRMLEAVPSLTADQSGPAPWISHWTDGEARVLATQPVGSTTDWLLVVEAPDDDFLRDVRASRRHYAIVATIVGILSTLLFVAAAVWVTRHIEELRRLARTDQLTGVLNRATARNELDQLLERSTDGDVAAMILDLDDFKIINDQFGHDAGDDVLVTTAERLREATGPNTILGRLGGDEFLVAVQHREGTRNVDAQLEHAIAHLRQLILSGGHEFEVHLSAGYSVQPAGETKTSGQMLTEADTALYDAKRVFSTALLPFDESMQMRSARDFVRKSELRAAIDAGEFELFFQPEFDLRTDRVIGAEGLLRWNHPEHGIIAANAFIEDLERFDLLGDLLRLLVDRSIDLVREFADGDFTMRLNLGPEQLLDPTLVSVMEGAARRAPSTTWCLEITERTMVEASSIVLANLHRLRDLGMKIALDDFGTGFSSLQELQQLPVDAIKIDRVFIQRLDKGDPSDSIAAILVDLASHLQVDIIAEGIETDGERAAVEAIGCTRAQGFLLGRPVRGETFLDRWQSTRVPLASEAA